MATLAASPHVPVREAWLARVSEAILEPGLPIVDAHHHIWDRPGARYLFEEFLADTRSGHDIRATVFVQCRSMLRASGPEALRPVGETEFVAGVAARSASGSYGHPFQGLLAWARTRAVATCSRAIAAST